MKYILQV